MEARAFGNGVPAAGKPPHVTLNSIISNTVNLCIHVLHFHHSRSSIRVVPIDFLLTDTALQLLEVVIHHGIIKPLGGWQAVAFATSTLGRLGHSTSTQG